MRILLIADDDFATRERAFLARLEVALSDEGVAVTHAVPARTAAALPPQGLARRVTFEDTGLFLERRARDLARSLTEGPVEAVHVFGSRAWSIAAEAARLLRAGLVVEVFTVAQARRLGTLGRGHRQAMFLTPDPALERAILREAPGVAARVALWGVHRPLESRTILEESRLPAVVVAGSGIDAPAWAPAWEGMARAAEAGAGFLIFADSDTVHRLSLWPRIQRLRLAERVSLVPGVEVNRELALQADIMVFPEAGGAHRSLTLDAMAAGMAIIAGADPFVGYLMHQRTAVLIAGPDPALWSSALSDVLAGPGSARRLGQSASEYVAQNHRVGGYAAAAIDSYEWMARRDSIPIRPQGAGL